jgi:MFS family permease
MFAKIGNSWALIKASAAVLRADKELIIFPIVSAIGVLVVTASFALPMILAGFFDALFEGRSQAFGFVVGFAFYIVQYFVIIFANTALVGAALIRLRGGDPTVGDGLRIAMKHVGAILGYALISATVGMILRWLSERGKTLGRIASSIGGLAWNLATYLVVPVLVVEGVGPMEAIKRSANLLKKTWGEQIAGNFSIGLIFGLLTVLVILLGIPTFIWVVSTNSPALIALTALLFVLVFVFVGLINSTLNGIYVAAVYRYAAEGEASGFFSEEMVRGAFRPTTGND